MRNRMRLAVAAPALSMAGFGLTGCSGQTRETETKARAASKQAGSAQTGDIQEKRDQADDGQVREGQIADDKTYKVALCLSNTVNDMDRCQSTYDRLKFPEADYGCEVTYAENLMPDDIEAAFADYTASGYDVVIGHGYEFGDPAVSVAEQYPDIRFITAEGEISADSMTSYVPKCEEGGYIMGMLAAGMSGNGKVGFIGPIQGAPFVKVMNRFEDGVKEVNPDIQVQTAWAGSFTDTALGKEAAQAMIDSGADVTGHCANESGAGAINAAKEAKIYTTGNSYDQNDLAPDTILSSSVYHTPHVIEVAFKTVANGIFRSGIYQLGIADRAVSVAPYHNLNSAIPDELKQRISDKAAAIESEEFEVPCGTRLRT